jgi:hypothetical protein
MGIYLKYLPVTSFEVGNERRELHILGCATAAGEMRAETSDIDLYRHSIIGNKTLNSRLMFFRSATPRLRKSVFGCGFSDAPVILGVFDTRVGCPEKRFL